MGYVVAWPNQAAPMNPRFARAYFHTGSFTFQMVDSWEAARGIFSPWFIGPFGWKPAALIYSEGVHEFI